MPSLRDLGCAWFFLLAQQQRWPRAREQHIDARSTQGRDPSARPRPTRDRDVGVVSGTVTKVARTGYDRSVTREKEEMAEVRALEKEKVESCMIEWKLMIGFEHW